VGKVILWVVVILGGLMVARVLARSKAASAAKAAAPPPDPAPARAAPGGNPEAMVRCSHCGVHLPRSEATMIGGNTWCSNEHARLGVRKLD
jgi:uncharacterized protein